ncbi:MAG: UDP-N-acetylmuramoyl-L-alanyl-D-glutamate--2,6-diaminopimelate ligase [Syntrophotaleaceae bacterium]
MTIATSMKMSELFQVLSPRAVFGPSEADVKGLFYDSREVVPGGAFFALRGAVTDGHRYIDQALERGAAVLVLEEERPLPSGVCGVLVEDCRRALALAAAAFYGDPTRQMTVVGVTGTNGKTTITYLMESILQAAGRRPAIMGTVNYRFGDLVLPSERTTPESVDLLRTIAKFRGAGADALVLEVSSHALEQHRVDGIYFDVGVFTNLTPEHLDYHGDLESYFASKGRLFQGLGGHGPAVGVVNIDDPFGERLADQLKNLSSCDLLACGLAPAADVRPARSVLSMGGIEATIHSPQGEFELLSPLLGEFNLHNLLCAAGAALALGIRPETVAAGLNQAPPVPGRLEPVPNELGALVLVDYAHTGDALDKVLGTLQDLKPRRLITVFGCGGDRDRNKRPIMGEVAARRSDLVVLTSDNPRTEDPLAIIADIRPGLDQVFGSEWSRREAATGNGRGFVVVPDRREAIDFAAGLLQPGDLLLVAGKGHEDYQIIGREKFHFDDREELRRALGKGSIS